jgi:hypothetical protein
MSSDSLNGQAGVVGWLEADLVPVQSWELDVVTQEATGLRCPLGLGD